MSNEKSAAASFVIESLTATELRKLNKMVIGYGNFKATAINAGMHIMTLRGVIQRGYGTPETIAKIRSFLNAESKVSL